MKRIDFVTFGTDTDFFNKADMNDSNAVQDKDAMANLPM
jgi:hypothetical protein